MVFRREDEQRVLAIDPMRRGFGYAVLEGPTRLIDWGTKGSRRWSDARTLQKVAGLVRYLQPDAVIVENTADSGSRRRERSRRMIVAVQAFADSNGLTRIAVTRKDVLNLFAGGKPINKRAIATAIATHFPELTPRIPPVRKAWMSEDLRTSIFDAVALALVHFFESDDSRSQKAADSGD